MRNDAKMSTPVALLALLLALFIGQFIGLPLSTAQTAHGAEAGVAIPDFELADLSGRKLSLYGEPAAKAVVIVAFGSGCPILRKSIPTIRETEKKYRSKGVRFLFLGVNSREDLAELKKELAADRLSHVSFLPDPGKKIARGLGLSRISEVLLVDAKAKARAYQGAIDDRFGYGTVKVQKGTPFLTTAIDALLSGAEIKTPYTEAKGCLISF